MKIEEAFPPNYEQICAVLTPNDGTIFCYGDTLYNPHKITITPDLEQHEAVHAKQQGNNPQQWWNRYLTDTDFRLKMEIEAYGEQYLFAKRHITNNSLLEWLKETMARALSGPEYGNLLQYSQAESRIKNYGKSN